MNVMEAIKTRWSVRQYADKQVEREKAGANYGGRQTCTFCQQRTEMEADCGKPNQN